MPFPLYMHRATAFALLGRRNDNSGKKIFGGGYLQRSYKHAGKKVRYNATSGSVVRSAGNTLLFAVARVSRSEYSRPAAKDFYIEHCFFSLKLYNAVALVFKEAIIALACFSRYNACYEKRTY